MGTHEADSVREDIQLLRAMLNSERGREDPLFREACAEVLRERLEHLEQLKRTGRAA
jgi:hypothetical protein